MLKVKMTEAKRKKVRKKIKQSAGFFTYLHDDTHMLKYVMQKPELYLF